MVSQPRPQTFTIFLLFLLSLTNLASASVGSMETNFQVNKRSPRPNSVAFPANLAKRFTSTVASLRQRSSEKSSQQVGRGMSEISKELKLMLARARAEVAKSSASSSAAYAPSATAAFRSTTAVHAGRATPVAAAAASQHAARSLRNPTEQLEFVYDQIARANWEDLDNTLLCPGQEEACPIFPRMGSYECIDTLSELESCGGCVSKGKGENCTTIKGAQGVTCSYGQCIVFKCQPGYKLEKDKKTGKDRCKRQTIQFTDVVAST